MRLGLGSYAFRWAIGTDAFRPVRPARVAELIEATAAAGLSLLQVADNAELDAADTDALRDVRREADRAGVALQTGASGLTASTLARQLEVGRELGSDLVRLVLDAGGAHPTRDEAVGLLRDAAPDYERAGIAIAIENHFMTPSREIVAIVSAVDSAYVGVCLDTANSVMVREWPEDTVALLAPYALCLHLKDYRVVSDPHGVGGHVVGVPLGEGWLDIEATLDALTGADDRADGRLAVILEQWLPLAADETTTLADERGARDDAIVRARRILEPRLERKRGSS